MDANETGEGDVFHIEWGHHFGSNAFQEMTTTVEEAVEKALSDFTENINRHVGKVVRAELDALEVSIDLYDDGSPPKIGLYNEGLDWSKGIPLIPLIRSEIALNPDFMSQLRALIRRVDEERLAEAEAKAAS